MPALRRLQWSVEIAAPASKVVLELPSREEAVAGPRGSRRPAAATKSYECSGSIPLLKVDGTSISSSRGSTTQKRSMDYKTNNFQRAEHLLFSLVATKQAKANHLKNTEE
jgi:hypothetical protein